MNALTPITGGAPQVLADFLEVFSLEITPKHTEKLDVISAGVPKGLPIYVALVDPNHHAPQVEAIAALRQAGFDPVPHIPARFMRNRDHLESHLGALVKAGEVDHMLVLGGGAPEPVGDYDAAIQLLKTGLFEQFGIKKIGIAGHPEGNADITRPHGEAALLEALKVKQAYLSEHGIDGYIATQFLFEADPVVSWAKELRAAGITLPLHIGIPGPATIKTLVKYAAVCGVGNSARFLRKQALNITKLLTVSAPDKLMQDLARLHHEQPELGIARAHLYPFGGYDRLFDWLTPLRKQQN